MADNIDVNVNVNTNQAQKNLNSLNQRLDTLQTSFGKLRNVIGGLALGAAAGNILRFSASMQDLAGSTNIALSSILGFDTAVRQSGGDAGDAANALNRFVLSIGEAAEGGLKAQNAFAKIGVSLQDLSTLSETELLAKTVQGFENLTDKITEAQVKNELFGKSLRTTNMAQVSAAFANATLQSMRYAKSIKDADQVQQDLEDIVRDLTLALTPVVAAFKDVSQVIKDNIESVKSFISVAIEIGKVVAIFFVLGRVLRLIVQGTQLLSAAFAGLSKGLSGLKTTFSAFGTQLKAVWKEGAVTSRTYEGLQKRFKYLREELPLLSKGLAVLGTAFYAAYEGAKQFFSGSNKVTTDAQVEALNRQSMGLHDLSKQERDLEKQRNVESGLKNRIEQIQELKRNYDLNTQSIIDNLNAEARYLSMSEDVAEVAKVQNDIYDNAIKLIGDLQNQASKLTEEEKALADEIYKQIDAIEASITADQIRAAQAIQNIQAIRFEQEKLNIVLEQATETLRDQEGLTALQDQLSTIGMIGDELEGNLVKLDVQRELNTKLNALALRALALENDRARIGEKRYQQELDNILQLTDAAYKYAEARIAIEQQILAAQKATQENAMLGASQALEEIAKQFKPYFMAQEAVQKGWQTIGNAIDTYIDTGKFKFKEFAASVIADLAKIIAKALVLQAIKSIFGSFGIPGLAEGGPAKANKPYIVGEKGPELFVPRTAGTVVPNNKLTDGGESVSGMVNAPVTNNYITNNINAVDAKSVAQLFVENRKTLLGTVKMAERELPYMA